MILEDFDSATDSIINPCHVESKVDGFPKTGVTCFSELLVDKIAKAFNAQIVAYSDSANGRIPIYKVVYKELEIALFMSRVGGPACSATYEEIMEMGLEKLVMFGNCGVLKKEIQDLAIIVPTSAIRDEGTSYHYVKASDEIAVNQKYLNKFIDILNEHNYSFVIGKTWTTDAPYRETFKKTEKRRQNGALCVEMECASMAAVSQFRNKDFFQFFYAGDNLDSANWEIRSLRSDTKLGQKEQIALLAFEMALRMNEG